MPTPLAIKPFVVTDDLKADLDELHERVVALQDSGALVVSTHRDMVTEILNLVDAIADQIAATAKPTPTSTNASPSSASTPSSTKV